jgi:hypothetical protein
MASSSLTDEVRAELAFLCRLIAARKRSSAEWAEVASDDKFESRHLLGQFDAAEGRFVFRHRRAGEESWFRLSLEDAHGVGEGHWPEIELSSSR